MSHFKKGSPEAKAWMAKLRGMVGRGGKSRAAQLERERIARGEGPTYPPLGSEGPPGHVYGQRGKNPLTPLEAERTLRGVSGAERSASRALRSGRYAESARMFGVAQGRAAVASQFSRDADWRARGAGAGRDAGHRGRDAVFSDLRYHRFLSGETRGKNPGRISSKAILREMSTIRDPHFWHTAEARDLEDLDEKSARILLEQIASGTTEFDDELSIPETRALYAQAVRNLRGRGKNPPLLILGNPGALRWDSSLNAETALVPRGSYSISYGDTAHGGHSFRVGFYGDFNQHEDLGRYSTLGEAKHAAEWHFGKRKMNPRMRGGKPETEAQERARLQADFRRRMDAPWPEQEARRVEELRQADLEIAAKYGSPAPSSMRKINPYPPKNEYGGRGKWAPSQVFAAAKRSGLPREAWAKAADEYMKTGFLAPEVLDVIRDWPAPIPDFGTDTRPLPNPPAWVESVHRRFPHATDAQKILRQIHAGKSTEEAIRYVVGPRGSGAHLLDEADIKKEAEWIEFQKGRGSNPTSGRFTARTVAGGTIQDFHSVDAPKGERVKIGRATFTAIGTIPTHTGSEPRTYWRGPGGRIAWLERGDVDGIVRDTHAADGIRSISSDRRAALRASNPLNDAEVGRILSRARGSEESAKFADEDGNREGAIALRASANTYRAVASDFSGASWRVRERAEGRAVNPSAKMLPPRILNSPGFKRELAAYRRRHGADPKFITVLNTPAGSPKFASAWGKSPEIKYDAPGESNKGRRVHKFGESGGKQPYLVSSVEKGPKYLQFIGGTFRANGEWIRR